MKYVIKYKWSHEENWYALDRYANPNQAGGRIEGLSKQYALDVASKCLSFKIEVKNGPV